MEKHMSNDVVHNVLVIFIQIRINYYFVVCLNSCTITD